MSPSLHPIPQRRSRAWMAGDTFISPREYGGVERPERTGNREHRGSTATGARTRSARVADRVMFSFPLHTRRCVILNEILRGDSRAERCFCPSERSERGERDAPAEGG